MGKKFIEHLLVFVCAVLAVSCGYLSLQAPVAHAVQSVPYQMNFQGRLNNASGAPMAAGTYNMRFRIYSVSSGGTALWTETRAVSASQGVTVTTGGLFTVQLGSVTSLPPAIFNSSAPLYLEVELPTPATATSSSPSWTEGAMSPRNPTESSPYAINSDLLDGLDSTAFATASGSANYIQNSNSGQTANFNITGTGTATLLQTATLDTASAGSLTVGGTNATGVIIGKNTSIASGKTFTINGSGFDANGNLGIGTTTPSTAFLVQSTVGGTLLSVNTSSNTITFGSSSNTITFTAAGGLVAGGTARHSKTIILPAEYVGAVLDAASDSSCASANNGTMTSGYDSTARMNFYNWTTTQATAQCYDVVVQIPLPSDFDGWASSPTINMKKDATGTAAYAVKIVDSTGTTDSSYNYSSSGTLGTSWSNITPTAFGNVVGTNGTTSYAPGNYFTVKIRMSSTSGANVSLGNISLSYNSKF